MESNLRAGRTFDSEKECRVIQGYLDAIDSEYWVEPTSLENSSLFTPPKRFDNDGSVLPSGGRDGIACSIEVWGIKISVRL